MLLCLCVFRNAPMCTQKKAGGGRIGVCREVHRKSSKENFATIRGPRRRPARPGRPSPASFLPPCKGRIQSSRWGALHIRRSLSRASAATPRPPPSRARRVVEVRPALGHAPPQGRWRVSCDDGHGNDDGDKQSTTIYKNENTILFMKKHPAYHFAFCRTR